jgi:predicted DNA-binding ribbon-helix-helix protein
MKRLTKSPVVKRSVVLVGHRTSVSLEDAFWTSLKEIAAARQTTLSKLVETIDAGRMHGNLSSAIRLFVLDQYRSQPQAADSVQPDEAQSSGETPLAPHEAGSDEQAQHAAEADA